MAMHLQQQEMAAAGIRPSPPPQQVPPVAAGVPSGAPPPQVQAVPSEPGDNVFHLLKIGMKNSLSYSSLLVS